MPGAPDLHSEDSAGRLRGRLRRQLLGMVVGLLVQFSLGMAVNLYATIPARHPGAHPSDFFTGSARSVGWAIAHGTGTLAVHAVFGLLLVGNAVGLVVAAVRADGRGVLWAVILGGALVVGAGFNGAAFLDFGHNANSLVMALLFAGAVLSYVLGLFAVDRQTRSEVSAGSP